MIVTIDGPAGAGKSTAARGLADHLGYRFLDTGAMYRAITLAGMRQQIDWQDSEALVRIAAGADLTLPDDQVFLNGEDVTQAIRTFEVTSLTHYAADNQTVRQLLVDLQQQIAAHTDTVTEGRDQATVVFPHAECKIYLTASDEVRAQRRYEDLLIRGEKVTFDEVLSKQKQRDLRDLKREIGGLRKAEDSIELSTDGLTTEQVIQQLVQIVRGRVTDKNQV